MLVRTGIGEATETLGLGEATTETLGLGEATTDTYNTLVVQLQDLQRMISQMNPNDPTAVQMGQKIFEAGVALNQYRGAVMQQLQDAANQIAAASGTARATGPSTTTPESSGVSNAAAGFIALGSAFAGGVAGYAIRSSMR